MDVSPVSPVASAVQIQVQKLMLDQLKYQGQASQQLLAAAAPAPAPSEPNLGRLLDVRV
jgi:hypothetical protein